VRGGSSEATVEGRFVGADGTEVVLSRVVPADGRSRAYVNGRMATVGALAELGERLVDLHGQHAHQSLLSGAAQREALDVFAGADLRPRAAAHARLRDLEEAVATAGGGSVGRAREAELLRYQLAELEAAKLIDPGEDEALAAEQEKLARAAAHREAANRAYEALMGEEQVLDRLGSAIAVLAGHQPLEGLRARLRGLAAELADIAGEVRSAAESLEEDPERLVEVAQRRGLLHELCRKYASPGAALSDVMRFEAEARSRLAELEGWSERVAQLELSVAEARSVLREAARELGQLRRAAAGSLGEAVEEELRHLAMPGARFSVRVGGSELRAEGSAEPGGGAAGDLRELAGDDVSFLLAANRGEALLPLSKVASGGELARAMLALRLVLSGLSGAVAQDQGGRERSELQLGQGGPGDAARTLVFDEVDAGIGGEAAVAVGRALAALGRRHQVIVVTHLAQVAAFADAQVGVTKLESAGRSVAVAKRLEGEERVVELSRMLSGRPGSETARRHAKELLASAQVGY
ncbi:MAG: DNA repair protein RecN, partial [Acidimicrobiales bacterium]